MPKEKPQHDPVEQSVHVDCSPEEAFQLFTDRFGEWYPDAKEQRIDPGDILVWDPPHRVKFEWHPQELGGGHQTVDVHFVETPDGTQVTLTHEGWQQAAVPACAARFAAFACDQLVMV
ncbi:MAG TPA: SRPBCC domain-containing protein [Bryobacteraceae bacterium]|nr:SRPBCC domain-containing protein [Bryobacteraceae bacterium]